MADQLDPNNLAQRAEQAATGTADSLIDDVASKAPGGDQFAGQAKDAVKQAVQGGEQQVIHAAEDEARALLDKLPGGIGEKLGGLFGGGSGNTGSDS